MDQRLEQRPTVGIQRGGGLVVSRRDGVQDVNGDAAF